MTSVVEDRCFDSPTPDHEYARWSPDSYPPIVADETHFLISREHFEALPVYQLTAPTGRIHGKCWRRKHDGEWWIGFYFQEEFGSQGMFSCFRKAMIV